MMLHDERPAPARLTIGAEADVLDLPCGECGNERSAVRRTATAGACAYCLNERTAALAESHRNRYRR
jgi:hypothetical protein